MPMRETIALAVLALLASAPLAAQTAPAAIPAPPLATTPYVFETGEVHPISVSVVAKGFARPFAFEFLPDGDLLVAERSGNLRLIRAATTPGAIMAAEPIAGMPLPGTTQGSFGLRDIAAHPDFARNGLIYWTWNVPVPAPMASRPTRAASRSCARALQMAR